MYSALIRKVRAERLLHDVVLELTFACNLDCFFCYNDKDAAGKPLEYEQYVRLFDHLARMQTLFLTLTGGEPLAHPRFFDIGRAARDRGFVIHLKTNGHAVRPAVAERILNEIEPYSIDVSLHGASAAIHDRQTGVPGSFERLLRNVRHMKAVGLRVAMVTTPTAWNATEIEAMLDLADSLATPLFFQGPVAPRDSGDPAPMEIQPSHDTWRRIEQLTEERGLKTRFERKPIKTADPALLPRVADDRVPKHCGTGTEGVLIDPFGNVMPCLHLRWPAGNLHQMGIEQIWNESPVFGRARALGDAAVVQFHGDRPSQLGAPVYCPAVEENCNKGCGGKWHS